MQLSRLLWAALAGAVMWPALARANDRVDFSTTWYQEKREACADCQQGLTVIHPQFDAEIDVGESAAFRFGYSADVVTGATASVYSVDAISTATPFDDIRHDGRLSLSLLGKRSTLTASGSVATERDYLSIAVGAAASVDLPGRNSTFALSYNHNFDEVCDRDNAMATPLERRALTGADPCEKNILRGEDTPGTTAWRELTIDTAQASLTQNVSPKVVLNLTLYGSILNGFQSNPYRRVRVGSTEPQEFVPTTRARGAVSARLNRYFPSLRGAVHLSARGYSDTWGVNSGTAEMGWSQYLADSLLLRVRGRIYQQKEAVFFKDAFYYQTESSAGAYFTGDRELGALRHFIVGGKLTMFKVGEDGAQVWSVFDRLELNLKTDLFFLSELPVNDLAANLGGVDRQFLSSGQLLDAIVVTLGLQLDF